MIRNALLVCGILSSLLYAALCTFIPMLWDGYDSASQAISELSAIDAPTRTLWMVLCIPYTLLVTAFGWGVVRSAGGDRRLRIAGWLIFAYGALGIGWPFFPMHLREVIAAGGGTFSDTMHIVFSMVTVLLMLLAMSFGAAAFGRGFRLYSIATILLLFAFGALTTVDAPNLDAGLPTPLMGLWERINIGVFLVWVIVLAVRLMGIEVGEEEGEAGREVEAGPVARHGV